MAKRNQAPKPNYKWLKVSQFFAGYLVAAWTFLQFLDWILKRYNISPNWVDMMLWLFVGIIPSLLIYLYNKERINSLILKRSEKIIFPLNAVLLAAVLFFAFGNNDLGATTQSVDYASVLGENKTATITKEEFRTGFGICNFEPLKNDSIYDWMELGISRLLYHDLLQNKNLSPEIFGVKSTTDKVKYVSMLYDSYVDGEFEITDSLYVITAFIRNSTNAKAITRETFKGSDLFNLIDSITIFVTDYFTPVKSNKPDYPDLKVKDFTSNSLRAIEYYAKRDYKNAIKEDSTFALAYLDYAKFSLDQNIGKLEERRLADKAYEYRDKLPIQKQSETLIFKNLAWDQLENAEELVKMQLAVDPSDPTYSGILYQIYFRTKNIEAIADHARKAWKNEHNAENASNYYGTFLIKGEFNKVLKGITVIEKLTDDTNEIFCYKIVPQLLKGDLKAASETLNKINLLHPDWENTTKVFDKALAYLQNHKISKEDMQKFEGEYRLDIGEMTTSVWIENNMLLQYASNQYIFPFIIAGDSTLIGGFAGGMTIQETFFKNVDNTFYLMKSEQNYLSRTASYWWWKIDDTITKAEALLEAGKLDRAEIAYTAAIQANPKHYYLQDALAHINYVKSVDSLALINQYKEVEGTYGPRVFWVENGKLYYSRTDFRSYGQVQLLPISKTRYINLTRFRDNLDFEYNDGKAFASYAWQFYCKKMEWEKQLDKGNYFKRDQNEPDVVATP